MASRPNRLREVAASFLALAGTTALGGCAIGPTIAGSVAAWATTLGAERYLLREPPARTLPIDAERVFREAVRVLRALDVREFWLHEGDGGVRVVNASFPQHGVVTIELTPLAPSLTKATVTARTAWLGQDFELGQAVLGRIEAAVAERRANRPSRPRGPLLSPRSERGRRAER